MQEICKKNWVMHAEKIFQNKMFQLLEHGVFAKGKTPPRSGLPDTTPAQRKH